MPDLRLPSRPQSTAALGRYLYAVLLMVYRPSEDAARPTSDLHYYYRIYAITTDARQLTICHISRMSNQSDCNASKVYRRISYVSRPCTLATAGLGSYYRCGIVFSLRGAVTNRSLSVCVSIGVPYIIATVASRHSSSRPEVDSEAV